MLLAAGTGRSFPGNDAGSPRIDTRYGGDRGRSLGASGAPPAAQPILRQALLAGTERLGQGLLLRHGAAARPLVVEVGALDAHPHNRSLVKGGLQAG